jgi:hypothetical protein
MSFVHDVPPMMRCRQNNSPFAGALGDWFPFRTYFLTSRASPNDARIVIVIIIIGEAELVLHGDGIIAQTYLPVEIYPGLRSGLQRVTLLFEQETIPFHLLRSLQTGGQKTKQEA